MGCVASTRTFFDNGKRSRQRWEAGRAAGSADVEQVLRAYRTRAAYDLSPPMYALFMTVVALRIVSRPASHLAPLIAASCVTLTLAVA